MNRRAYAACVLAAALLCACSGGSHVTNRPSASPRNPLNFPLYPGATLVSAHAFADRGAGYRGVEVIASSQASFQQLSAWAQRLAVSPPPGYTHVQGEGDAQDRSQAQQYGLDYAGFEHHVGDAKRGVLVVVMDPQRVNRRFGVILGLISKYRILPAMLRQPIDDQAKKSIGITLTQAMQPDSPIGAALDALQQFEHRNSRGIVVLDASKV